MGIFIPGDQHAGRQKVERRNSTLLAVFFACAGLVTWEMRSSAEEIDPNAASSEQQYMQRALQTVGRLLVPNVRYENGYAKHFDERCSATLVSLRANAPQSRFILSAWHCVEHYRDLSRTLMFTRPGAAARSARIVASGGNMQNDWALLKLDKPLPNPMFINDTGMRMRMQSDTPNLVMAGFPKDQPQALSPVLVSGCTNTGFAGDDLRSSCVITRGASGGAVFAKSDTPNGDLILVGVISRGDSESISIYVPVARFRSRLASYL